MERIGIGVSGCGGRMGRMLTAFIQRHDRCRVVAGCEAPGSPHIGKDVGGLAGIAPVGANASADAEAIFKASDAVIDFSVPAATVALAEAAARHGKPLVIGTDGFTNDQRQAIVTSGTRAPIVWAPNSSLVFALLSRLVRETARLLDDRYDIEVLELLHNRNVHVPTVTSRELIEAAAQGRGVDPSTSRCAVRDGKIAPRRPGEIGFAALRGGDAVGDHTVVFAAEGERLELTHRVTSRDVHLRGTVDAALWAVKQPPGFYLMHDVLGSDKP